MVERTVKIWRHRMTQGLKILRDQYRNEFYYFDCMCSTPEHTIRLIRDPEEGTVWMEVHLTQWRSVFKRIWVAVAYVFGYRCRYGNWDTTELHPADAERMIALMEMVLNDLDGKPNLRVLAGEKDDKE